MRQCTRLPNGAEMNGFRGAARFLTSLHIFEGLRQQLLRFNHKQLRQPREPGS